jgi:excinuclease UvrABC nuclease subunit
MATKSANFNKSSIEKLPNDKPAIYRIQTDSGKTNYVGVAKRGRVLDRIEEHLPNGKDPVPGAKVKIEQMPSIDAAREKEANIISRAEPKYNEKGK